MVKVSVIVPVYNAGKYVARCLDSVCSQTLEDIEVLCVENASADDSLAVCEAYAARDGRVKVIDLGENRGPGPARNEAIARARGEFLAFIDADDWYPDPSSLEVLYRGAVEHGCAIAGGCMSEYNAQTGEVVDDYRGRGHLEAYQFVRDGVLDYRDWQSDLGWIRFIYRRSLIVDNAIGFPDLSRHEDPVFLVRAMVAAGRFYASTVTAYRYRIFHKDGALTRRNIDDALEGISIVLGIAEAHELRTLRAWCVETIWWYLTLSPEWAEREARIDELHRRIDEEVAEAGRIRAELDEVLNSKSFRLGERIAWPYRKLRDLRSGRAGGASSKEVDGEAPTERRPGAERSEGDAGTLESVPPSVVAQALGAERRLRDCTAEGPLEHILKAPDQQLALLVDAMVEAGDGMRLARALSEASLDMATLCRLARALRLSATFTACDDGRAVESVACYYYAVSGGGVETSMLAMRDANACALDVSLVTENAAYAPAGGEEGERVVSVADIMAAKGVSRTEAFACALRETGCDTLVYHAWADPKILWDLMVCRLLGIRFVVQVHGSFTHFMNVSDAGFGMLDEGRTFAYVPRVAALCDAVVCLTAVNKRFFSHFGKRTFEVRHALPKGLSAMPEEGAGSARDENLIVWVGRFDEYKHPEDALAIFKRVREKLPRARLAMLGEAFGGDFEGEASVANLARRLGIEDAVELPGFVDAKPYYEKASLLLFTSEIEGCPMVLLEACACGLPVVSYALPYTPFAPCKGITWVGQADRGQAAAEVVGLLCDREKRLRLGALEREFIASDAAYVDADSWADVFASLADPAPPHDGDPLDDLMWDTLLDHYLVGQQRAHNRLASG